MEPLLDRSPEAFAGTLRALGLSRAWLARDPSGKEIRVSTPELAELCTPLATSRVWDDHEAVFLAVGPETGSLLAAAVHRTTRGQAQGGLRHWRYETLGELLRDALALSRAMSRKNALAGLWWGGGKGVIARAAGDRHRDPGFRRILYREYGAFVSSLRGCYVTAEDVGTRPEDVAEVFARTRFVTCIPPSLGGSGNPSRATAAGVLQGIEAALAHAGRSGVPGRTFAVQGLGQVGAALVEGLVRGGAARVVGADVDDERVRDLAERHRGAPVELRTAAAGDATLLEEPCDVFAPCALGGVLDPETIASLGAAIVCGAANAPLADEVRDARLLAARGVLFVPAFVVNRMGIVQCANEQYGALEPDPAVERHLDPSDPESIHATTLRVLERAAAAGTTPVEAAHALADGRLAVPHPLWPGRAAAIVRSLLEGDWARDRVGAPPAHVGERGER